MSMREFLAAHRALNKKVTNNTRFVNFPVSSNNFSSQMESWCSVLVENQSLSGKININKVSEPFISPQDTRNFGTKTQFFYKPSSHIAYF